jgi:uncharacterized protein (TIRG00374 family)
MAAIGSTPRIKSSLRPDGEVATVGLPLDIAGALRSILSANLAIVVVALVCEAITFVSMWTLQRLVLRVDGWAEVAAPQLAGNAASNALPAGSAIGSVIQVRMLHRHGVDFTRAIVSLAFTGMVATLAGLALFPLLALVPIGDRRVDPTSGIPLVLAFLVVCIPVFLLALRGDRSVRWLARTCQSILRRASFVHPPPDLAERIVHERDQIHTALRRRPALVCLTAIGYVLGDYFALYFSMVAVGMRPSPAVVLFAYMAAAAAGMVPLTPGGLGFVEAGLTGALVLAGADTSQALAATAIYRLVACWLPVAAGVIAYVWSRTATRATAAAPTSGPSAPSPAGTMRAPRANSKHATASSSDCAASKNGAPKPSATEPATTASGRSSKLTTEPTARPTRAPVRSTT